MKGRWTYLYCAVDRTGMTVDFLLRQARCGCRQTVFRRAFKSQGRLPQKITFDGYQASHRAAREWLEQHQGARTKILSKYLNYLIEPDHRSIKRRLGPMLGLKRFRNASDHPRWYQTHAPDQKKSVQARKASHQRPPGARNLECNTRRMSRLIPCRSAALSRKLCSTAVTDNEKDFAGLQVVNPIRGAV
nr:transposase [Methylocella tundrae]